MNKDIPNLFIAGVAKSGTTVLANYLGQHPDVFMSKIKEPNFFTSQELSEAQLYYKTKPIKDRKDYLSLFKEASQEKWKGEASVSYFFYKECANRIKQFSPEAKVILVIRHPIDRAYSHYLMDKRLGFVKHTFEDISLNPIKFKQHYEQYILQSFYYENLKIYKECFKDNLLILPWQPNLEVYLEEVYQFLGLESIAVESTEANKSLQPNNKLLQQMYANTFIRRGIKKIFPAQMTQLIKSTSFVKQENELSEDLYVKLNKMFSKDILKTQVLINRDLKFKFSRR